MRVPILLILLLSLSTPAYAYIGPGLGAGTVAVILGILISVILGIFALFWYPIKRIFKLGKNNENESNQDQS